jgi:signal transduction histidine kinase
VAVATLITFGVGWLMARRSLRPLRRITARAKSLSEHDLGQPIALQGPRDELRELADTFDEMLGRLDRAFEGQRLFAANASHELRTPLTLIRTKLDVTLAKGDVSSAELEEMATTIRGAVERSTRLVDALLTLARARGPIRSEPVALEEVVRGVLVEIANEARERNLSVTSSLEACSVLGDPVLLVHNVEGGSVAVSTGIDGAVELRVVNTGPVVAASSVDRLFLPLQRGAADRIHASGDGFGLGLTIVKAVAEAHQGSVRADPMADGGLAIEVSLPAAVVTTRDVSHGGERTTALQR